MNWLRWFLISLLLLLLIGTGGYFLYDTAYAGGETAGYEEGYSIGHQDGYDSGEQDGYKDGYDSGMEDGYTLGEQDGYEDGYALGEQDGYNKGYVSGEEDGYQQGYSEGIRYSQEYGYALRDPSYEEALAFLEKDMTDQNEYIEDSYGVYVCSHFSRDVCNNAEKEGLRCAYVELRYQWGAHTIIAFNTTDEGLVYFEPQADARANPVIGQRYWLSVEAETGTYHEEPLYDDTIMDILVIW